jgi:hypothetical protein
MYLQCQYVIYKNGHTTAIAYTVCESLSLTAGGVTLPKETAPSDRIGILDEFIVTLMPQGL